MSKMKYCIINRKTLIICFSVCVLAVAVIVFAVTHSTSAPTAASTKQLPIYCVDKSEKVASLSFDAAWGNESSSKQYWLTHKMSGSKMTVTMKESGLTDYFVFRTSDSNWSWVLVCTCE